MLRVEDADGPAKVVVVRVAPGGADYEVIVVDDADETGAVKARFGPFRS